MNIINKLLGHMQHSKFESDFSMVDFEISDFKVKVFFSVKNLNNYHKFNQ